jgi:hypothetical protein
MAADRFRRAKPILITGTAAFALAVAGIGWVAWPRGSTTISHEDALEDFRRSYAADNRAEGSAADSSGSSITGARNTTGQPSTPAPGVYTYTAEGNEQVKLGPFPAEDRQLPGTISIVVSAPRVGTDSDGSAVETHNATQATGCFDWTLNLFAEHTEQATWCVADGTLRMAAHTKHQSIGALSPTATLNCDPDILIDPGTSESDLECELRLDGGPAAISASIAGTATVLPKEQLTLGKSRSDNTASRNTEVVRTTPLAITYTVSGDLSGSWSEKLWLTEDMLPVRITRDLELTGPATFTEHSVLELSHLAPTR